MPGYRVIRHMIDYYQSGDVEPRIRHSVAKIDFSRDSWHGNSIRRWLKFEAHGNGDTRGEEGGERKGGKCARGISKLGILCSSRGSIIGRLPKASENEKISLLVGLPTQIASILIFLALFVPF